jgi:hypothetical protein
MAVRMKEVPEPDSCRHAEDDRSSEFGACVGLIGVYLRSSAVQNVDCRLRQAAVFAI